MNKLTKAAINEINRSTPHHAEIKLQKLHPVKVDQALLQQVMINLISNAVKYSSKKEKPVVEIISKKKEN